MAKEEEKKEDGPALGSDPEYAENFKMKKMGIPIGGVKNAMVRDGKDPLIADLDPTKPLATQRKDEHAESENDDGPPLKDDPEYSKYFKMLNVGMPANLG